MSLQTPFVVELRDCPHRTQQQILFHIIDALPRFSGLALDARGNGSALAEAARQEYGPELVEQVMITEGWYRETMPKVKSRIEDRSVTLPKNANILSDLRSLRVVKGVATGLGYNALYRVARTVGTRIDRAMLDKMQVLEFDLLNEIAERRKREREAEKRG